jgi:hypothetical protein
MISNAIDRILRLDRQIITKEIDGRLYSKDALNRVPYPHESFPAPIGFSTLRGISEFALDLAQGLASAQGLAGEELFFHAESPKSVTLCGRLQPSNFNNRFCYAAAKLNHIPFQFSTISLPRWLDLEMLVISLQSLFEETENREKIISMLGNLASENVTDQKDDGFQQKIQVKLGISQKSEVKLENPVTLKPYRTFRELDQPEGRYILRLDNKQQGGIHCALFEADGDLWKIEAMLSIKNFLHNETSITAIA